MAVYMMLGVVTLGAGAAPGPGDLERVLQARAAPGSPGSTGAGRAAFAAAAARRPDRAAAPDAPPGEALHQTDQLLVVADAYLYRDAPAGPAPPAARRIAQVYQAEGEAGLDRIEGDFACAVYDKAADRLVVRRDPFGVRPLYIAHKPGRWYAFATLPEFLLEAGLAGRARDWAASRRQLASPSPGPDATLLKDVTRLRPGRQAVVDREAVRVTRYFQPAPEPGAPADYPAWSAELKRRFEAAVARRLPARGVVGSHLTSGLDSAGVALIAARLLPDDRQYIDAYCIGASEEARAFTLDETDFAARAAAGSNRVGFTVVRIEPDHEFGFVDERPERLGTDPGPHRRAAEGAALNGAEVFLSGLGGDQSVSYTGWGAGAELLRRRRWRAARDYFRAERARGKSPARVAANMVLPLLGPAGLTYRLHQRLGGGARGRDAALSMSGLRRGRLREFGAGRAAPGPDTARNQSQAFETGQIDHQLEAYARIGLAAGVRYTFPLLDAALVAWSMTCRAEFHHRGGRARAPMRDLLKGVLPDEMRVLEKNARLPAPELSYRLAQRKADYLDRLARLETDARLRQWYDFKRLRRDLQTIGTPEAARARLAEHARRGRQPPGTPQAAAFMAIARMEALQRWLDEEAEAPDRSEAGADVAG